MLASSVKVSPIIRRTAFRGITARFVGSSSNAAASVLSSSQNSKNGSSSSNSNWLAMAVTTGLGIATIGSVTFMEPHYSQPKAMIPTGETPRSIKTAPKVNQPTIRPDLPTFSREEVAEHCDEDSLWYTFRGGVYDLTTFYQGHPGGAPVSRSELTALKN
jgi:hypothetical protein